MKNRNKIKHTITASTGTLSFRALQNAANMAITNSAVPDWFSLQWNYSEYWFSSFRFTHSNRWNKSYLWFYYKNNFISKRLKVLEYE